MPHLECVNEEYQHYFIVDSPKQKKRKVKRNYFYDLPWDIKKFIPRFRNRLSKI